MIGFLVLLVFFILLGMGATAFGVDSREGFGDDFMNPRYR